MARLAKGRCKVIGTTQKAQSPAATGLSANENTNVEILDPKRETTLIARFALKGAAVHRLADGGFIVAQWGLSRHCVDFASLMAFARQMGVM
jgi:hypothetical protein